MKKLLLFILLLLPILAIAQTTFDAGAQVTMSVPNDNVTGTTVNELAKINSSGNAVITGTSDTNVPAFIVVGSAGTTGNVHLATNGAITCKFDAGGGTAQHYVTASTTIAGMCHDAGATKPTSGWIVGQLLSSPAANANGVVLILHQNAGLPPGTSDGQLPIWNASTGQYVAADPQMQGTQPDGSTTKPNPLGLGGWDYTNGLLKLAALDPTTHSLLALVLKEPLLNISTCSDCTVSGAATGGVIAGSSNQWTQIAETFGSEFLGVGQTTIAAPAAPTLSVGNGDGTYAQGQTIFVQLTGVGPTTVCVTSPCQTSPSAEASILLSAGNGCTANCSAHVTIPALTGNLTGYTVWATTVSGVERQIAGCVNITSASSPCIVTANAAFTSNFPPYYNTAYSGTAVVESWGGIVGQYASGTIPVMVSQDSPTINNFLTVFGNNTTALPPTLGGKGCFWRGPTSSGVQPMAMWECGNGTGHRIDFAYRQSAVDTTVGSISDGLASHNLSHGLLSGWGEGDFSVINTVHFNLNDTNAFGSGDLCSRATNAIASAQCSDLTNHCVLHAESMTNTQNCATPFSPNRPTTLLLGRVTITATTSFITPTNVGGDPSGLIVQGCGIDCTKVTTNSATADIINTGPVASGLAGLMQFRDLSLFSNVTRTAGAAINATAAPARVENVHIVNTFDGVKVANASSVYVDDLYCDTNSSLGGNFNTCLNFGGTAAGTFVSNVLVKRVTAQASFATAGMLIDSGVDTLQSYDGLYLNTGAHPGVLMQNSVGGGIAPRWVQIVGGDAETNALSNSFEVTACNSCSVVSASAQTSLIGFHFNGAGVTGFTVAEGRINNIQNSGVKLDAGTGVDVHDEKVFDTGLATNNTFPVFNVAANVNNFNFHDNDTTSPSPQANKANTCLTVAAGTSDNYKFTGNNCANVVATGTAIISDGGTGSNKRIKDNFPLAINQANPIRLFATADTSSTSNTLANITGLTWPIAALQTSTFDCNIIYQVSSTTGSPALQLSVNGPASPTQVSYCAGGFTALTASYIENVACAQGTTYQTKLFGAVPTVATTNLMAKIHGTLENGSTAGTAAIQLSNPLAAGASVTVKRDSECQVN